MSSNIFKLTPRLIKKIIAEERQKLIEEKEAKDSKDKKKLLEALNLYFKIKKQQEKSNEAINVLRKFINENKNKRK